MNNLEDYPELRQAEKVHYLVSLIHDEFIESVVAGHDEDYKEWAWFMGQCLNQLLIPDPRQSEE